MSSSMLEQAVIDANELKEAAIKNAEQEVLAKYSREIKEAVDSLLEQEEDPFALGGEEDLGGEEVERDELADELSMKAVDGEDLCPCPSGGEEVELDLDALKKAVEAVEEEEPMDLGGAEEMMFETTDTELQELLNEKTELENPEKADLDDDGELSSYEKKRGQAVEKSMKSEDLDEEIELDEETLKDAIGEILRVDLKNVPRGAIGTTHPTEGEQIRAVEVAAAAAEDTEQKEQNEEYEKALKKIANLEEQVKSLKSDKNRLVKEHNELKSIARQVSDKLTEINNTNAKLVYQNRILESHSLNERQKEKLVEAVSNANSIEEAKVIYETLQDSLSSKGARAPKNLNEAVSKNNRLVLKSNNKETQASDSASERMKKLAGII